MVWYQLKIEHCPSEEIEQISEELEESGALSIMLTDKNDNPVLEPEPGTTPLWPEVIIQALYAQAEHAQEAKNTLTLSRPPLECSIEVLADKDWERAWMDDFKPQQFGTRLWICPTWMTPPEPEAVNLMLDPGLAFGTGTHPTTALCLTWLEQADLNNKTLIDYGCGSGILSLAAVKLGAQHVVAVDIDNQALQATQNNALTNQITDQQLSISFPEALQAPVDLIIANILLAPLISLNDRFYQLLNQGAELVVSGILTEQADSLIEAYKDLFTHVRTNHLDGWSLLVFTRK
ncbi:50S ribosomal protein L11 methyltransferase [Legionella bononiensis]|uniref:Ribosomal protein L11 methyltransferase n=1 Tax=Legionella bononiensis TaxID=2793102 RepID=A0ABS1W943_9GAMM|nr:50S ribosomal protein L11 methyltransferase [Legionella bononiensis]MBL7479624.1 50S ribosomal protein L11 methyltransferase [Legionella bononiensis]MBL7525864.1 50S ribosomal protein L11 methyltransferase [Legionella bononiensis]MBL7562330.1 50S ribosomal protein L11 methyltransferase [Legionella bononiensis]